MEKSDIRLKTYTDESLPVVGEVVVNVKHNKQAKDLVLTIVGGDGPSLLGRDWLKQLKLDWKAIHSLQEQGCNESRRPVSEVLRVVFRGARHYKIVSGQAKRRSSSQSKILQSPYSTVCTKECH